MAAVFGLAGKHPELQQQISESRVEEILCMQQLEIACPGRLILNMICRHADEKKYLVFQTPILLILCTSRIVACHHG